MNKFLLYGHGGSYNHGAEAIVKTTIQMIRDKYPNAHIGLSSHFPGQDKEFGLEADAIYGPDVAVWECEKKTTEFNKRRELAHIMYAEALGQINKDTVCLSVGGDVFCYSNWHRLAVFQERAVEMGAKTILWGCSIEPSVITAEMLDVLRTYTMITARESITYNALSNHGLADKLMLAPDPAFTLQPVPFPLPDNIAPKHTVGINISPLVIRREALPGILFDNIRFLIRHIITELGYNVMLIPHVVMPADNDFELLSKIWDSLSENEKNKTFLFDNCRSAAEYKYAISQCESLVCARTHASIAAYSLGIPVLVLGYSVKARGIAFDLGMGDYVLDISKITAPAVLAGVFVSLHNDRERINAHLKQLMPEYMAGIDRMWEVIKKCNTTLSCWSADSVHSVNRIY
jgi:polysaccharide pyruvyl transferase WcaK-like protein